MRNSAHYHVVLSIPSSEIRRGALLYSQKLFRCGGIDQADFIRRYPDECRKCPSEWVDSWEGQSNSGKPLLVISWRNLVQNKRTPAFSREFGVCQTAAEQVEKSQRSYYGISFLEDGRLRADCLDFRKSIPDDILYWGAGIPVLWERRVSTMGEILPEVSDFPHLFDMTVTSAKGTDNQDLSRFKRFQQVYELVRLASVGEARKVLMEAFRTLKGEEKPLLRNHNYLHNFVGQRKDGGLVSVIAHGSLERIGELAREAGAVSGVIVDNGGSVNLSLRNPGDTGLVPVISSYYHRPRAVAVAVFELKEPASGRLFSGMAQGTAAEERVQFIRAKQNQQTSLLFRYHTLQGVVKRRIAIPTHDLESADKVGLEIGNFAMSHGAYSVELDAPVDFIHQVVSFFHQRYRITPRALDPHKRRGMWLDHYLEDVYRKPLDGKPFKIASKGGFSESSAPPAQPLRINPGCKPAELTLGFDVGGTQIKCLVMQNGFVELGKSMVKTRGNGCSYETRVLEAQIRSAADEACRAAGVEMGNIDAFGVSWPGAVQNGRAATSKTMLDLEDLERSGYDPKLLDRIQDLGPWFRSILGLALDFPAAPYNDGSAEAAYISHAYELRGVLLLKIGATIAGGYVDENGGSDQLMEAGRMVIRTDKHAPRHPFSQTIGFASRLVGSHFLYEASKTRGLCAVNIDSAGTDLENIIAGGGDAADTATEIIKEMGINLSVLIGECIHHLDRIQHILIRGGLAGDHAVGRLLMKTMRDNLPPEVSALIFPELPNQHTGAFAVAWLAARMNL